VARAVRVTAKIARWWIAGAHRPCGCGFQGPGQMLLTQRQHLPPVSQVPVSAFAVVGNPAGLDHLRSRRGMCRSAFANP